MSLFVETGQIDPDKNYLEDLVGEGRKYKTPQDLARAAMEKDLHISRIEAENKKVRDDLHATVREGELYDKIKSLFEKSPSNGQQTNPDANGTNNNQPANQAGLTPEQIDELLSRKVTQLEVSRREQDNENLVKAKMVEKFGTNYGIRLKEEAAKIDVTSEYLDSVARANPTAFFRLMGMEETPKGFQSLVTPPRNAVEGFKPATYGDRTQAYYEQMRKKDPITYNSKAIQEQEYKDALRLGEAFFDKINN